METFMNIIKSDLGSLLLQVGIPLVIFIGAGFAVIAGYKNLQNQIKTKEELAQRAEEINQAFDSIAELKDVLVSQKDELTKQILATGNINTELEYQKEFNNNLREISLLSLRIRNGNKEAFEKLMQLEKKLKSDEIYEEYFYQEERNFRLLWDEEVEKENSFVYQIIKTGERKKWSVEYLQSALVNHDPIGLKKDALAILNEIVKGDFTYLLNDLYKITMEDRNIYTSINAAHAFCKILNFEPYVSKASFAYKPIALFKSDITEFKKLKKWWTQNGALKEEYNCPFDKLNTQNVLLKLQFDCKSHKATKERIEELKSLIISYPRLARTKAELGYLILNDSTTYEEVIRLSNEALHETDMETLPYLLLAYIEYNKNNKKINKGFEQLIIQAYKAYSFETVFRTLQMNEKFQLMFRDAQVVLNNHLAHIQSE
jgi:hypothetical protein